MDLPARRLLRILRNHHHVARRPDRAAEIARRQARLGHMDSTVEVDVRRLHLQFQIGGDRQAGLGHIQYQKLLSLCRQFQSPVRQPGQIQRPVKLDAAVPGTGPALQLQSTVGGRGQFHSDVLDMDAGRWHPQGGITETRACLHVRRTQ